MRWFENNIENSVLTPPSDESSKSSSDSYQEFSLSWKSSEEKNVMPENKNDPIEITLKIEEEGEIKKEEKR